MSPDGSMEVYTRPVKAAELMLENHGMFVCESSSLVVGHRIQGLSADEELEKRQLYLLLPMELLYSVLTPEEMSSFTSFGTNSKPSTNNKHNNGSLANFGKIFPSLGEFCLFLPNSETKTLGSPVHCHSVPVDQRLYSKQRSWRPALETIFETPCRSHWIYIFHTLLFLFPFLFFISPSELLFCLFIYLSPNLENGEYIPSLITTLWSGNFDRHSWLLRSCKLIMKNLLTKKKVLFSV